MDDWEKEGTVVRGACPFLFIRCNFTRGLISGPGRG